MPPSLLPRGLLPGLKLVVKRIHLGGESVSAAVGSHRTVLGLYPSGVLLPVMGLPLLLPPVIGVIDPPVGPIVREAICVV